MMTNRLMTKPHGLHDIFFSMLGHNFELIIEPSLCYRFVILSSRDGSRGGRKE